MANGATKNKQAARAAKKAAATESLAPPAQPEDDPSSVPAAEVLPPERDSVTPAPLAPDAPYVYANLDDQNCPNSTVLNTRPDANLLGANQEKPETAPALSKSRSASLQPENISTQREETGDTRRELELTPGELRASYLDLNGRITVRLDIYVDSAAKAKTDFKALLPLLDEMHSMLSQRAPKRKLMNTLGLPTWSDWFEDFRSRLHEDINIRTIQRWLREYRNRDRETHPPKDVNVLAKESIRHLESKPQAQKLDAAVEARKQLNPTIRQDMIRALEAQAHKLLALAGKLKKGFRPLPVAETGKAHQRLVREHRAKLPDPLLEEKRKLAADFTHARVEQISYDTAKNVILANEYLGSMGSATHCFGLYVGEHLASVVCFGSVAGTNVAASVCGPEYSEKVKVLVRGATEPWAHKHSASYLIARACDQMAAKGYPIIVAYSDPAGGEVGQIYSACNFLYTGKRNGTEQFKTPDGKLHDSRQVGGLTRDRRNGELRYKRSRAEQKKLLLEQGCEFVKAGSKHRFVHFAGNGRTTRILRRALRWEILPHPKRAISGQKHAAENLRYIVPNLVPKLVPTQEREHSA